MYRIQLISLFVLGCAVTACGSGDGLDACQEVDGQTYLSIEQHECGQGPNGPVMCNWSIRFSAGAFDWSYSDIGTSGTYTCDGAQISGIAAGSTFAGALDSETRVLTWNGIDYQEAPTL